MGAGCRSTQGRRWKIAGCLLAGTITIGTVEPAIAQIIPDATLGTENSVISPTQAVIRGVVSDRIFGGAQRGVNLFHSFDQFNVGLNQGAYFDNPVGVTNIFSRITGATPSNILGTLGVIQAGSTTTLGNADLYFINPNGILFGAASRLDVGGSFLATTASAMQFGDAGLFSATTPEVPSALLTINPSAFLFNQVAPGNIIISSIAPSIPGSTFLVGLRVPNGERLTLLAGNLLVDGYLSAFGGRIDLGAVAGRGIVQLNANGSIGIPDTLARADVTFSGAFLNVSLDDGGDIGVTANNIDVLQNSSLLAGISSGLGSEGSQAGDIVLNATGMIQVTGASSIRDDVAPNAIGAGGNIALVANQLSVSQGSLLSTITFERGDAGSIFLTVSDRISFDGTSIAFSTVEQGAVGRAGNIEIHTGSLSVTNGAQLVASTRGRGNAGNVMINARDRISFDGTSANGKFGSAALSTVEQGAVGRAGNIEIETGSLSVTNGAQLTASTLGQGDAGNVMINARDRISFDGGSANGQFTSAAFSSVSQGGIGRGGNIKIHTGSLSVTNGASLVASTVGQGDAGNVFITALDRISFDGGSANGKFMSAAFSSVLQGGIGRGGNVEIHTGSLSITNGAQLTANTLGQGDAGNILITAREGILLRGTNYGYSSGIFTNNYLASTGQGGNIQIESATFRIANGAVVSAPTRTLRQGGSVVITTGQFEAIDGGQIIVTARNRGRAGSITINADSVTLSGHDPNFSDRLRRFSTALANQGNGESGIFANTRGVNSTGLGGSITINANDVFLDNGAIVTARSQGQGGAGNLLINTQNLELIDSNISTRASRSTGGDIFIYAQDQTQLTDSNITTSADESRGGDIFINAVQGNNDSVRLSDRGIILLEGDSDITTNSQKDGGDITIGGQGIIAFDDSDIITRSDDGNGGDITLSALFSESVPLGSADDYDRNNQVDLNAEGELAAGIITINDTSFIQNNLADLADTAVNADSLIANSCIARTEQGGTFLVTGSGGLPERPGQPTVATYPTGAVQGLPQATSHAENPPGWQIGDPIVEPQGVFQLPDGRLVMSRNCEP